MISDVQYRQSLAVINDLNSKIDELTRQNTVLRGHERTIANHVRTIGEQQNQIEGRNADVVALNKSVSDKDKLIAALRMEGNDALGEMSRLFGVIILYQDDIRALSNKKSAADAEVVRLNKIIKTKDAGIAALRKAKTDVENALWWCKKRGAELTALYKILRDEHDNCLPLFKMVCIVTGRGKIEGAHSYPANMNVTIAAVPKAGWVLVYAGFTLDGEDIETPYKFVMPDHDIIVTAQFVWVDDGEDSEEVLTGAGLISEAYEEVLTTERGAALVVEEYVDVGGGGGEDDRNVALLTEAGDLLVVEERALAAFASEAGDQIITEVGAVLIL